MPELVKKTCNLFPIRLIKTVRLRVRFVEPLLTDPDLALKIIVLVRDPRGVMRSRLVLNFLNSDFNLQFAYVLVNSHLFLDHI